MTKEWIKELEEGAKETLKSYEKGNLHSNTEDNYVHYSSFLGKDYIILRDTFTITQLESLVTHMKQYQEEK